MTLPLVLGLVLIRFGNHIIFVPATQNGGHTLAHRLRPLPKLMPGLIGKPETGARASLSATETSSGGQAATDTQPTLRS